MNSFIKGNASTGCPPPFCAAGGFAGHQHGARPSAQNVRAASPPEALPKARAGHSPTNWHAGPPEASSFFGYRAAGLQDGSSCRPSTHTNWPRRAAGGSRRPSTSESRECGSESRHTGETPRDYPIFFIIIIDTHSLVQPKEIKTNFKEIFAVNFRTMSNEMHRKNKNH